MKIASFNFLQTALHPSCYSDNDVDIKTSVIKSDSDIKEDTLQGPSCKTLSIYRVIPLTGFKKSTILRKFSKNGFKTRRIRPHRQHTITQLAPSFCLKKYIILVTQDTGYVTCDMQYMLRGEHSLRMSCGLIYKT